jgi:hypothetical protein
MARSGSFIALDPEDVTVDEEGRVVVTSPHVSEMIKAAKPTPVPLAPNQNCGGGTCNFVAHCGVKVQ